MVNKVILLGNLGKDPEIKTLDNGVKVANFSLATTEKYKDKASGEMVEATEWHNVQAWRQLADIIERYLSKGSKVYIEGKIQTRSYEHEGVTKYRTDIIANQLKMLGGQQQGQTGNQLNGEQAQQFNESQGGEDPDLPF